ncbi:MAG: hypothetical protein SGI97_08235 [candidate division Zixibacteria bacterium]|nr:hypothetical protein [candidate division Zixibacteria bacterium]
MNNKLNSSLILLLTFFISLSAARAEDLALIDSAMSQVGKTRNDLTFDQDEMANWQGDKWRLSFFTMFHRNPLKFPQYGDLTAETCRGSMTDISALAAYTSRLVNYPVRRGLIGDALEKYLVFPDSVSKPSYTRSKNVLVGAELNRLKDKIDLLYAIADDNTFPLKIALDDFDKGKYRTKLFEFFLNQDADTGKVPAMIEEFIDKFDFNLLSAGAQDIAEACERIADSLEFITFPKIKTEIKTRKGLIIVGTTGNDSFEYLEPPLLIIDGGGDDTYSYSGINGDYPLSVIIDAGGNDRYTSNDSTKPGIGGAVLSVSVVIDKAGDDLYDAQHVAQGCGIFGVGILLDKSGHDTYRAKHLSQGAGLFGMGILSDVSGDDSLSCYSESQGYGFTRGCGLLINGEGNDLYKAEDSILFSPSPQTKEHNSSLAQGVGFGRRADYLDGHSWAGGVGILCDLKGNDSYSAGLFAQGCAYWFAVGMLLDGGGNDTYNGVWYVQGSGAHFGAGYLDDFSGDDIYTATHNMALGAGHDFTVGFLNERTGNDTYSAPNLSLGGGNDNGMGIFFDHSGDDTYSTKSGITLGRAGTSAQSNSARRYLGVWGIFIDAAGNDNYNEPYAKNGSRWIGPPSKPKSLSEHEIGVGFDRE